MSEAKIDAGAFEEMEGRAAAATPGPWDRLRNSVVLMDDNGREIVTLGKHGTSDDLNFIASLRADVPNLIADLRAARAEVERLSDENRKLKAEVARHEDADVARAVQAMGPSWQCSACAHVYRGRLHSKCQACGREGYYSGSVRSELLAKYDAEQAKRIRARRGES